MAGLEVRREVWLCPADRAPLALQIDEDPSLVPEAIQGGTFGFNSSANVPAEGFQF